MMNDPDSALADFEARLGHRFRNAALLHSALSHPSIQQEHPGADNNQRLEFLGDAVLQLIVTEKLHALYPLEREGVLTQRRATITRGSFLTALAHKLGVERVIQVSASERSSGGHERAAALEDAIEALAAAVYLDSDWETARRVVLAWLGDVEEHIKNLETDINPKGRLQELVQPAHGNSALSYRVIKLDGPPHNRVFEVEVLLLDLPLATGSGSSKKEAEEEAARAALLKMPPRAP